MKSFLPLLGCFLLLTNSATAGEFRAGAAVVDVTPTQLPVLINGNMLSNQASKTKTAVQARAIVLDDGNTRLAIVVVDSCMMDRAFLDDVKKAAAALTAIRPEKMLISATHTHSAPASMGCLGTDADPLYVPFLKGKLVGAIVSAEAALQPAKAGWGTANAADFTAVRRWIRRPDRVAEDPFGNRTVRANMHAAQVLEDVTGESGPEDPELSLISFQARDGRPIAVLANFSMHYFGDAPISADYFGLFCEGFQQQIGLKQDDAQPPFVAVMSHGCSGDIWRRDYTRPADKSTIDEFARGLLKIARTAYDAITYREEIDLAMAEARLPMAYRVPDKQRLEWAQRIVGEMGDRPPKNVTEVYAREQVLLHERQSTVIVTQAVRIGDMAIATTPNETYALTGLKLKLQSPLPRTMVIELANGGDGYIPPPEQHLLGGYNTWPARSAGLEITAEPRIVQAALGLLEEVCQRPRRVWRQSVGPAADALLKAKPIAFWRLDEWAGPRVIDSTSHRHDAFYEPGVVFFLEGPRSDVFTGAELNRAAHFAGGRLQARLPVSADRYSVSLWFWNGMPAQARPVAGWLVSHGYNFGSASGSQHLGIGGQDHDGKIIFQRGLDERNQQRLSGKTPITRWTWNHLVLVRDGKRIRVYLNGAETPEIDAVVSGEDAVATQDWYFGGRCDHQSNWEGRLDEIAFFDRALSVTEIKQLTVSLADR